MEDVIAFIELSALLTGLKKRLIDDPEDRVLFQPIAAEYQRRLLAVVPEELKKLLAAYKLLASATPKPPINDALLSALQATPEFQDKKCSLPRGRS